MIKNKNNEIILYLPNWIPTLEDKKSITSLFNDFNNFNYFNWKIENDEESLKSQTYPITKIESLCNQLVSYFEANNNKKFILVVNSFSLLILHLVYDEIKGYVNKLIMLNPFDKSIYLKGMNIKGKMIPNNNRDAFLKYMYLCDNLEFLRKNQSLIDSVHNEVKMFSDLSLLHHKIFDQIIKIRTINNYFEWISDRKWNCYVIVGEKNPLINLTKNKKLFNQINNNYFVIKNAGYCIQWENPVEMKKILKKIM